MNRRAFYILIAIAIGLASCKSNKTTVRRQPQRVENSVLRDVPRGAESKPGYAVDAKLGAKLVDEAMGWMGTPYKYGGETKKGTDCSGMLMVIFRDVAKLSLPRNSAAQHDYCFEISKRGLQPGDLVFFSTSKGRGKVSHVGMYVGDGKIIHASSSRGVILSSLSEKYYETHYHSSGRVYGITYAATGAKAPSAKKDDILIAANIPAAKPVESAAAAAPAQVAEMTLDEFMAMQKPSPAVDADTVLVVEEIVEQTVEELDSAEVAVAQARNVCRADSVLPADTCVVAAPEVMVNGKPVRAIPVEDKKECTAEQDSVGTSEEIRRTVSKAMKFGK